MYGLGSYIEIETISKHFWYRPELRAPPPFTPQGEVVKPVPEKSFIQKYWMYIAALVLILRTSFIESILELNF